MRIRTTLLTGLATTMIAGTLTIGATASADQPSPSNCLYDPNGQCQLASAPSSAKLDTTFSATISEPDPWNADGSDATDATGTRYAADARMEYLCGAGSTAVALSYWKDVQHFSNNYRLRTGATNTTWDNNHGRSYLAYLANDVQPQDGNGNVLFSGVVDFTGSVPDASNERVLDTLNWEASGHQPGALNYPYGMTDAASLDRYSLLADIQYDVWQRQKPVVVAVNDAYLPGWHKSDPSQGTAHLVTIVGYDSDNYTYIETCGSIGCQTDGTGVRTVSRDQLLNGLKDDGGEGALFW